MFDKNDDLLIFAPLIRSKARRALDKNSPTEYVWSSWTQYPISVQTEEPIRLYFPKGDTSKEGQLRSGSRRRRGR